MQRGAASYSGEALPQNQGGSEERRRQSAACSADIGFLGRGGGIYPSHVECFAPYVAEFVGTFLLMSCFVANIANSAAGTMTPVERSLSWSTTSHALMMVALQGTFAHVSGANLNPSVTIALTLSGRITFSRAWKICLTQILGAMLATGLVRIALSGQAYDAFDIDLGPRGGKGPAEVALVEVLYTGLICFVYLNCAASWKNNPTRDQNGFAALAVGFTYIAGGHASADVSGSVMNPAISFGMQLLDLGGKDPTGWAVFYLLWEIVGAFLAAGAQRVVRPEEIQDAAHNIGSNSSATIMAEFIGTYYVILTKELVHKTLHLSEPWAVGSVLLCMNYSLRDISGALLNPAVTLSAYLGAPTHQGPLSGGKSLDLRKAATYVGAQIFAGIMATSTFVLIEGDATLALMPGGNRRVMGQGMLMETVFTFMLCYVVLSTSLLNPAPVKDTEQNNVSGLSVAGVHVVSGIAAGHLSGSVLNPAVALAYSGLAGLRGDGNSFCLQYIFYEMFGAAFASAAFTTTHGHIINKTPSLTSGADAFDP